MAQVPPAGGPSNPLTDEPEQPTFKLYKPAGPHPVSATPDLPESYFTPTAADLKGAQAALSARTQSLVNAPLQLRSQREAAEKSKRDRWPNTTIRVRFTDRTQLEKTFPSTDKIRSVYAFVRSSLRDDIKPIKFILYQSPPRRDLKVSDPQVRDLSLAELHLTPSSVLMLRFEDDSLNASDVSAPLLPSILSQAIDLPAPPNFDVVPPSQASSASQTQPYSVGEKKIPKWMQAAMRKK